MSAPTTFLALLACLLAVHCIPIKESQLDGRLSSLHLSGPGSLANINGNHLNDHLIRQVRKDKPFEAYITFKNKPPVTLTELGNGRYVLECEVSGSVYPNIYWMKDHHRIIQGPHVEMERHPNQLGLSMVKSRLYLDCSDELDQKVVYQCIGETPSETIRSDAVLVIADKLAILKHSQRNIPAEKYMNQNSIDAEPSNGINHESYFPSGSSTGCLVKKTLSAPARIYYYTLTTLENIGSDSVIHCRATGFPKPVVSWYDSNNDPILPDYHKYQILSSGDLLIRNITFDDMGKYKCLAHNQYGSDSIDKIFFYPTDPNPELERK